MKAMWC